MKVLILISIFVIGSAAAAQNFDGRVSFSQEDGEAESHTRMITPEEEVGNSGGDGFFKMFRTHQYRFPQTTWGECSEAITGNYSGYACSDRRNISVILKKFLADNIYACTDAGLKTAGGGRVSQLHIVHAGITGDAEHSPRSLHAENRAIDLKILDMKLAGGALKKLTYAGTTNRKFYTAFRNCWAEVIAKQNGCPYQSTKMYTGSIGWENADHRQHLHLSVPYCVGGRYSSAYYQR